MTHPIARLAVLLAFIATGPCVAQRPAPAPSPAAAYTPPVHNDAPPAYARLSDFETVAEANRAMQAERDREPAWELAEHRRLDRALAALAPQRKGVVDAYIVVVGTDSDPVFGREAREAARVLARRYNAAGHTIVLAMSDGRAESEFPRGSPDNLGIALARIAELMDRSEDVLVLYTTGHGAPMGLAYNDGSAGIALLGPQWLRQSLDGLGIANRMLILSACYSGVFIAPLSTPTTAIVTAASADRSSFGCAADNDWTFFGDALINHALRKPAGFAAAVEEARTTITGWEAQGDLKPSRPTVVIGGAVERWLTPLEARLPAATTAPVGRPATAILAELKRH